MHEILNPWRIVYRCVSQMQLVFYCLFNCYLAVLWQTLGHSQVDSFTNPVLITALSKYWSGSHQELRHTVGSASLAERLFVLLTFQVVHQGQSQHENWTWHDCWNLLIAIKAKDKYFQNSIDWSGFFFKFISLQNWGNVQIYRCQITRKCICETPLLLAWSNH